MSYCRLNLESVWATVRFIHLKYNPTVFFVFTDLKHKTTQQGKLKKEKLIELHQILSLIDFKELKKQHSNKLIRDLPKITITYGEYNVNFSGRKSAPPPVLKLIKWADDYHQQQLSAS
jgi:hypothetical protein